MREICERHNLPYNTGSLSRQLGSVVRKIFRLALPRARTTRPELSARRNSRVRWEQAPDPG